MIDGLRPTSAQLEALCCPACRADLTFSAEVCSCSSTTCAATYPVVDGVPILIDEAKSIFSVSDFENNTETTLRLDRSGIKKLVDRMSPSITSNPTSNDNYRLFVREVQRLSATPKVLIIGAGISGHGMEPLFGNDGIELLETDVSFGPRTAVICDGHDLPIEDGFFDGVVAQAVLEHVVDPYRCVEEMHRVLRPGGVVFADTPFMQQGHMGPYDFTRFTYLGHRRLFRKFTEIKSGVGCGPGTAFAWSYQYFLLSLSARKRVRTVLRHFANFTSFYFKYLDRFLNDKPGAYDSASSYFFLGARSDIVLADKDLLSQFRGLS